MFWLILGITLGLIIMSFVFLFILCLCKASAMADRNSEEYLRQLYIKEREEKEEEQNGKNN